MTGWCVQTIEMRSGRRFTQHFVETRQELDRALLATMRERGARTRRSAQGLPQQLPAEPAGLDDGLHVASAKVIRAGAQRGGAGLAASRWVPWRRCSSLRRE
jgi:hypothetical protein